MPADVAPAWFTDALRAPSRRGAVEVAGEPIAYTAWGDPGDRGMVLIHGGAANARWWDHVAPMLAGDRRVVALDLSGHGDSGRRTEYTLTQWADELAAVAQASGVGERPTVVGHSMGGFVALQAAREHGDLLGDVVVLDSPVRDPAPEEAAAIGRRAFGPLHRYPDKAAAVGRFRAVPEQDDVLPYVLRHIAESSVRETDGGWTWKFDPAIFRRPIMRPDDLSPLAGRVALFRSEYGRLSKDMVDVMDDRLGGRALVVELPGAGHHMMLDQPLALVAALRTLLTAWSTPPR